MKSKDCINVMIIVCYGPFVAHLLQTEADRLGALDGADEFALAYGLFNDVAKVFKVLEKNTNTQSYFKHDH